jgi:hypothetical protein
VQFTLDRGQGNVHDRRVEDHHQLAEAEHAKRDPAAPLALALGLLAGASLEGSQLLGCGGGGAHQLLLPGCAVENTIAGIIIGAEMIVRVMRIATTWYNLARYDR